MALQCILDTELGWSRGGVGRYVLRLCLQNPNLSIPITLFPLGVYVSGVVCNSTVIVHGAWPPDSNLDVTLPLGSSLLWETTRVGDTTKKYYGARVLLLVLETSDPSNQMGDVTGHVKFAQHMTSLLGLAN